MTDDSQLHKECVLPPVALFHPSRPQTSTEIIESLSSSPPSAPPSPLALFFELLSRVSRPNPLCLFQLASVASISQFHRLLRRWTLSSGCKLSTIRKRFMKSLAVPPASPPLSGSSLPKARPPPFSSLHPFLCLIWFHLLSFSLNSFHRRMHRCHCYLRRCCSCVPHSPPAAASAAAAYENP